jgi:hypothetical protein
MEVMEGPLILKRVPVTCFTINGAHTAIYGLVGILLPSTFKAERMSAEAKPHTYQVSEAGGKMMEDDSQLDT